MKIAVVGYGKMGHEVETVLRERRHEPACVDMGEPFPAGCVVGIDFTDPGAVVGNVQSALAAGARYVVGTTGWSERRGEVEAAGTKFALPAQVHFRRFAAERGRPVRIGRVYSPPAIAA